MIGARLREARLARGLSLSNVASRADISVSTLSRIETDKQNLDLGLFVSLARILAVDPATLLGSEEKDGDGLVSEVASLDPGRRVEFWRDLAETRRGQRKTRPGPTLAASEVEEILAQIDFIREEIVAVRSRMQARKRR